MRIPSNVKIETSENGTAVYMHPASDDKYIILREVLVFMVEYLADNIDAEIICDDVLKFDKLVHGRITANDFSSLFSRLKTSD